jgi:hypothetical protein
LAVVFVLSAFLDNIAAALFVMCATFLGPFAAAARELRLEVNPAPFRK